MQEYEQILSAMQERYRELTGFEADSASDIGIRMRVLADRLAEVYEEAEQVRQQAFPQTGTGVYLDRHAQARGLSRKPALPAQGVLRFSRSIPSANDITIARGTVCATRLTPQVQFETTQDGVLAAGSLSVEIPARAIDLGDQGNVAPGSICLMVSTAPGITGVTNPAAFADGLDEEEDEALRTRLLNGYKTISNGTNRAFYYNLAMQDDGVSTVNVIPRARGRGTVDVVICGPIHSETATVARLQKLFDTQREINVDVKVRKAARVPVELAVQIGLEDGYEFSTVSTQCLRVLTRFMQEMGVGQVLMVARIIRELLAVEGVANCKVQLPAGDKDPGGDKVLRDGGIVVDHMGAS